MNRLLDVIREGWQEDRGTGIVRPWYRRPNAWMLAAAIVLPFGWLLPVVKVAYVQARNRRARRV